jgi:uncharacterized membrane protein YgcG
MNYLQQLTQLTRQYNDAIRALENAYDMEHQQESFMSRMFGVLESNYSDRYDVLAEEYRQKRRQLFRTYQAEHPDWARWRKRWGILFCLGILFLFVGCLGHLGTIADNDPVPATSQAVSQTVSQTAENYWNADNIPIPYLQDSTQYVSNPDHVLQQQTVDRMNVTLKRLENELGIQSIFIVVNHIENDDPFRMAQDVGNKYGVGYQDRGLIVVVGYEDHSVNMSPGRSLEGDLTDAECHRLEQQYVVPAMRKEMPDSAMLYLAEAVYSTLQKKQMPVMSLKSQADDDDSEIVIILGIWLLLFIAWCVFYLKLNDKYFWFAHSGATALLANPFMESGSVFIGGGGGGGGGFSGGGGGGGFSGGSFGGGSFGGGGATSRW